MSFTITCNNCGHSVVIKENKEKPNEYMEWPDSLYIIQDQRYGGGDINCEKCKHEVTFI